MCILSYTRSWSSSEAESIFGKCKRSATPARLLTSCHHHRFRPAGCRVIALPLVCLLHYTQECDVFLDHSGVIQSPAYELTPGLNTVKEVPEWLESSLLVKERDSSVSLATNFLAWPTSDSACLYFTPSEAQNNCESLVTSRKRDQG